VFNKRKTNGTEALERELAAARARRTKLTEQLAGAGAHSLMRSPIGARRCSNLTAILEIAATSSGEGPIATRSSTRSRSSRPRSRISKAGSAKRKDKHVRAEAAAELAGHTRKLADAIEALRTAGVAVVAALPDVLSRVPFSNPHLPKDWATCCSPT
jgi:hypothetical protein